MTTTRQEHLDAPIAVARILRGELAHRGDHRCIALRPAATRSRSVDRATDSSAHARRTEIAALVHT